MSLQDRSRRPNVLLVMTESHADLIPTLLGPAGIDQQEALTKLKARHTEAHPLVGRDISNAIRNAQHEVPSEAILFTTDDENSEGSNPGSPFRKAGRPLHTYAFVKQPNHLETAIAEVDVDGDTHLVKFSRYHDNQQFWTVPVERDERLRGRKTITVTEREPDEHELYDLTVDPFEERNLAHPSHADDDSQRRHEKMFGLLIKQLTEKRLVPHAGEARGYHPPQSSQDQTRRHVRA
jgi:hypothetical protein